MVHLLVGLRSASAIRPWQHVLELLSGYLRLAAQMLESVEPALGTGWNLGPNADELATVRDLVELILARPEQPRWEDLSATVLPQEARAIRPCDDKARAALG